MKIPSSKKQLRLLIYSLKENDIEFRNNAMNYKI